MKTKDIDLKELAEMLKYKLRIRVKSDDSEVSNIRNVVFSLELEGIVLSEDSIKIKG